MSATHTEERVPQPAGVPAAAPGRGSRARREKLVRGLLVAVALAYVLVLLLGPLAGLIVYAFKAGLGVIGQTFTQHDALHAFYLTFVIMLVTVVVNTVFGVIVALVLARDRFPGKRLVSALVDLPLAVSPVIVGLMAILLFGRGGWFEPFLADHDFIMFDQRGTGYSEPTLDCPEISDLAYETLDQNLSADDSNRLNVEAAVKCHDRLAKQGVDLAAYTSATIRASRAAHPCAPPHTDQALTIGGAPARLLTMICPAGSGFLVEIAVTVHHGTAFVFASQNPFKFGSQNPRKADRAAFRNFLDGIRLPR